MVNDSLWLKQWIILMPHHWALTCRHCEYLQSIHARSDETRTLHHCDKYLHIWITFIFQLRRNLDLESEKRKPLFTLLSFPFLFWKKNQKRILNGCPLRVDIDHVWQDYRGSQASRSYLISCTHPNRPFIWTFKMNYFNSTGSHSIVTNSFNVLLSLETLLQLRMTFLRNGLRLSDGLFTLTGTGKGNGTGTIECFTNTQHWQ